MVTYEVVTTIDAAHRARFEHYMQHRHIAEVLATGCFTGATLERSADGRYRTRYQARTAEDVERYLSHHTAALRADFAAHFPEGVAVTRDRWTELSQLHPAVTP
jgi:hypothetical protein